MWVNATLALTLEQRPQLLEAVLAGVDGALCHLGSTSQSALNVLLPPKELWFQQVAVRTGASGCLDLPGSTPEAVQVARLWRPTQMPRTKSAHEFCAPMELPLYSWEVLGSFQFTL